MVVDGALKFLAGSFPYLLERQYVHVTISAQIITLQLCLCGVVIYKISISTSGAGRGRMRTHKFVRCRKLNQLLQARRLILIPCNCLEIMICSILYYDAYAELQGY